MERKRIGADLIESMNDEFHPDKYREEYRIRVLAMLEAKSKGPEIIITPSPEPRYGQVIDLMQALKQSLENPTRRKKSAPLSARKRPVHVVNGLQ